MAESEHKRGIELSAIGDEEEAVAVPLVAHGAKDAVLRIRNIHKTYLLGIEGVPALRGVSLNVRRGEIVMVLGKSGCGKTSLLNVCGTIDRPTRGDIMLCHERVTSETADAALAALRLRHISFVFQTFNLLPTMTAIENVELPMVLLGKLSAAERRARARELLTRVGMGHRLDHVPAQLSGGEQQRVTIARSLANRPELLLLDEPTGDLDTRNTLEVMELLLKINQEEGITMIMVTHNPDLECYADRVLFVADGKFESQLLNYEQRALDLEAYLTHLHHEDASTNALLIEQAQQRLREQEEHGWGDEAEAEAETAAEAERKDPMDESRPTTAQSTVHKGRASSRQVDMMVGDAEEDGDETPSATGGSVPPQAQVASRSET
mmetsp:Transcript_28337/g.91788  ORF Transcript_28337/g.91788 Transcript_28337/m.91788 type:complete len:380 (+) Transcript_28337:8-1147(+)